MKKFILVFTFLLPLVSDGKILSGVAKNQKSETVYTEKHSIELDESGLSKLIRVEYFKPDGTLFAKMMSDFSKSKTVPDTTFEDFRFQTKLTLQKTDSNVEFEEFKNNQSQEKKSHPYSEDMVASQGFDNFIKINSARLKSQNVKFKFGVLESKDFFTLVGFEKTSDSPELVEYRIKAKNLLFRIFAGELKAVYDAKTMRLKSFSGRSNILNDSQQAQDVEISYQWNEK